MKLIYIVEDGRGNKKIGMTSDIKRRVTQLRTAIPNGIVSVMISDFMENARAVEKQLHDANKAYRLSGEWFSKVVDFCDIDFSYSTTDIARKSILMFQDSLELIATDKELTGATKSVLFLLLSRLEFENYIHIRQVEIAEKLSMHKPDVSKSIKMLVQKGIIMKINEGAAGYKLNPQYGWKGKVENLEAEKERIKVIEMDKIREARFPTPPASSEPLESSDFNIDDAPY
ncbi:MAG: GIY-YIG nuclease family protein [Methylococcales bacterium]|nr:GIY-YIG nuclease family protein [Methylococcales bacterium]MDD5754785.1 GIY-YIG nuclease family protein [Methylococcales bacterium]